MRSGSTAMTYPLVLTVEADSELNLADGDERNNCVYEINALVATAPDFCMSSPFALGCGVVTGGS
mgnify:CR=1 FL=1